MSYDFRPNIDKRKMNPVEAILTGLILVAAFFGPFIWMAILWFS